MRAANKRFQDVTNNCPKVLLETEYFPFEKKNRSCSDSNPGPLPCQIYWLHPG